MSSPAILVVEDEIFIRMFAVDTLLDAGFEVFEAGDAEEALTRLEENPTISVLFTDINMPGRLDGLELARSAREERPGLKVIITSGKRWPEADEIPQDGLFLAKPYKGVDILKLIKRTTSH